MDIRALIKQDESEILEFKESLQLKDEIGETVSAFSNLKGGIILVGVSDRKEAKGVQIGKRTLTELAEYIKRNTDSQIFPEIETAEIKKQNIVKIKVKLSIEKPVFFKGHAYKRVGNTNQRISSSEIRKLAKESKGKIYWDEQICKGASLKDVDEERIRQFLKESKHERNLNISVDMPVSEVLMRLNLLKKKKPTNASILLFGREPQKFFLQAEVRCVRFKGNEPVKPFIDMRLISGNIIEQVNKSLNFVLEHIPKAIWLEGKPQREEKYQYPAAAVRETIVNAICHRNYEEKGNIQIRIFDDYLEVWSPGELLKPLTPEDLKRTHKSIPRNPLIARQFFWIRFVEEVGTGTNDIVKYCKEWKIPEPEFKHITGDFVVTFRSEITNEYLASLGLNERQIKVINYLKEYNKVDRKTYCDICGVKKTIAHKELAYMVKKRIIKIVSRGRGSHYVMRI